jgi:hypothetical protein
MNFTSNRDGSLDAIYSQLLRDAIQARRARLTEQFGIHWRKHETPFTPERMKEIEQQALNIYGE